MAATTFYAQQAANRRRSWLLLVSAALLLGALGFAIGFGTTGDLVGGGLITVGALVLAVFMGLGSYFRGDSLVLAASKARETNEEESPQLMNVVREMTLAAGLPMPRVYLIDDTALNAFATGRDPEHASIAVTTGLLERLDREELQGVIGHELAHVRNLDIRFMLLIGVVVGGIALLAGIFLRYSFFFGARRGGGGGRGRGGGPLQLIVLVLALVLAILAPISARLVQLSVSRQREYLADATSVELTRNPAGLEQALSKIATDREVLEVANQATQHLYIANPVKKFEERSSKLFSTHPPVAERIDRLRRLRGAAPLSEEERAALARH